MSRCRLCLPFLISLVIHMLIIGVILYKKKEEMEVSSSHQPHTMQLSQFVQETPQHVATPQALPQKVTPPKKPPLVKDKPLLPLPKVSKPTPETNATRSVATPPSQPRKASRFLEALNENYTPTPSKVKELYGEEFDALKPEQKKFIKDNLEGIGKVTQEYLYKTPLTIIKTMKGMAIVEFTLEPNGDITNLRVRQSSTYTILDKHAIRTIENAYKEYPKPTVPTPIRIFVTYTIER